MTESFLILSLRRVWVAFAGLTVFGFAASYGIEVENPLRSDDPYVIGFACGTLAAGMSVVYSIAEKLCGGRWWATLCYGVAVCLWSAFLVAMTANSNEGKQVGQLIAVASLVVGAIGWPLFAFHIPRQPAKMLTVGALIALGMYAVVAVRMAMRY